MEPAPKRAPSASAEAGNCPTEPPPSSVFSVHADTKQLSSAALEHFDRSGYIVLRQVIASDEADTVRTEIHRIIDEWYDTFDETGVEDADWVSMVNREERARSGEMSVRSKEDRYLSVRRLFRMAVHDTFFQKMACDRDLIRNVVRQLLGDDVKLLQSMALLKPPGAAAKRWHQDNGYFRLTPNRVMAMWIAIDEATVENGCMHVVAGSHRHGVDEHTSPNGNHKLYSLTETPAEDTVVPIPLKPGDALVFHGELHHFTPPNRSNQPRYGVQLHYASARCRPTVCPKSSATATADNMAATAASGGDADSERAQLGEAREASEQSCDRHGRGGGANGSDKRSVAFDCDPSIKCVEPQFWFFRKAEVPVFGNDYGDPHI